MGFIGANANSSIESLQNSIVIGNNADVSTNNTIQLGNNQVTNFNCEVPLTVTSDKRTKKNINDEKLGLKFINSLNPVNYNKIKPSEYPKEIKNKNIQDSTEDK